MVRDRDGVRKTLCGAVLPAICRQTTRSQVVFIVSVKTKAAASWDSPLQRAPTAHLGLGSEQRALVERVAAHCRGRWTGRDLKSPSNPNHSPVLQLSVPSCLKARERLLARVDTRPWPVLPSKLLVLSAHRTVSQSHAAFGSQQLNRPPPHTHCSGLLSNTGQVLLPSLSHLGGQCPHHWERCLGAWFTSPRWGPGS